MTQEVATPRPDPPRARHDDRRRARGARPSAGRALALYAVLLVLPTVGLGALLHANLSADLEEELAALPEVANDAATRLVSGLRTELESLLAREENRPFTHFAAIFEPEGALRDQPIGLPSRLALEGPQPGILAWFSLDTLPFLGLYAPPHPGGARLDFLSAEHTPAAGGRDATREAVGELRRACEALAREQLSAPEVERLRRIYECVPRRANAAAMLRLWSQALGRPPTERAQVAEMLDRHYPLLAGARAEVSVGPYHKVAFVDADERLRLALVRRVLLGGIEEDALRRAPDLRQRTVAPSLLQGVLLDADWLFGDALGRAADRSLGRDQMLSELGAPDGPEGGTALVDLLAELRFEVSSTVEAGVAHVAVSVDPRRALARHRSRLGRFWALAGMIVLLLATGMALLVQNVRREVRRAERLRDFAAAVSHELRTPLSTIRLHAEMLTDGWTTDPERQHEYFARIAEEAERLGELVEKVLESSRFTGGVPTGGPSFATEPGDLSAAVAGLRPGLGAGAGDLAFDLAPNLPPVGLAREPLAGIVLNLVQNARRYAPPGAGGEPILVRTARAGDGAALEVADRGPGVPEEERRRVFEPFRRVADQGHERVRGSGLGLYLVDLYARALGGRAECLERPGGGALFRVTLPRARGERTGRR